MEKDLLHTFNYTNFKENNYLVKFPLWALFCYDAKSDQTQVNSFYKRWIVKCGKLHVWRFLFCNLFILTNILSSEQIEVFILSPLNTKWLENIYKHLMLIRDIHHYFCRSLSTSLLLAHLLYIALATVDHPVNILKN